MWYITKTYTNEIRFLRSMQSLFEGEYDGCAFVFVFFENKGKHVL